MTHDHGNVKRLHGICEGKNFENFHSLLEDFILGIGTDKFDEPSVIHLAAAPDMKQNICS